jgi:hypothetical protein
MAARSDSIQTDPIQTWIQRGWQAPWLWMALIVALFCVPLFTSLDRQDFENDEAIYSFGVNVMLKSGDWLTPRSIPSETSCSSSAATEVLDRRAADSLGPAAGERIRCGSGTR